MCGWKIRRTLAGSLVGSVSDPRFSTSLRFGPLKSVAHGPSERFAKALRNCESPLAGHGDPAAIIRFIGGPAALA